MRTRCQRENPDVGVAVVPTLQAFEILIRLFARSGKMYRCGAITTEVECSKIRAEAGVIVIARTIRVVASVADWHHCTPGSSFVVNNKKMLADRSRISEGRYASVARVGTG